MTFFEKPSKILIKKLFDPTIRKIQRKKFGLPFDDQVLAKDARYMHYSPNRKRIVIRVDLLHRQYYNRVGNISYLQLLLPVQLLAIFLKSLHSTASKHPVLSQMMQEKRRNYYVPSLAKYVRNWVQECETCSNDKRSRNMKLEPELFNVLSWDKGLEDAMHTDLHPKLPPSGDYESVVTARGVFSRYPKSKPPKRTSHTANLYSFQIGKPTYTIKIV